MAVLVALLAAYGVFLIYTAGAFGWSGPGLGPSVAGAFAATFPVASSRARRAPEELRPAFVTAEREWLLSTDFPRTVSTLKERLADPTADATLETLLVAYDVGGSDLERRLAALVEDRVQDLQGRKDAYAKQAGVRFANTLHTEPGGSSRHLSTRLTHAVGLEPPCVVERLPGREIL